MEKSHVAGWASDAPTPAQLKEFFAQIESGRITQDGLQSFLQKSSKKKMGPNFPVWKTIRLGMGLKTADDFRHALRAGGYRIGDWANCLFDRSAFNAAGQEMEVNLVRVSSSELGFPKGAARQQIYDRAKELGLDLCPPEVGPQLRLQYKGQPKGEWLTIGMKPITDSDDNLMLFSVVDGGDDLWLSCCCGGPDDFWYWGDDWVFLSRK